MSNKPDFVNVIRFFEIGKKAPSGSSFKGIVTANSIFGTYGLFEYDGRETTTSSKSNDQLDSFSDTSNDEKRNDSFFDYTSRYTDGNNHTMTNFGYLDTSEKRNNFKQLGLTQLSKEGRLCWEIVISMKDIESASKYGLLKQDDYAQIVKLIMPEFFRQNGFDPLKMIWWEDHHSIAKNGKELHPHIHIAFYEIETDNNRTKGTFSEKSLDRLKRMIVTELLKRQDLIENIGTDYRSFFNDVNAQRADLIETIRNVDIKKVKSINSLYAILPKSGRLQYNSANMIPYRNAIMEVVDLLLKKDEIKDVYKNYIELLELYDKTVEQKANKKITTRKEQEINKLKVEIANYILSQRKNFDTIDKPKMTKHYYPSLCTTDWKKLESTLKDNNYKMDDIIYNNYKELFNKIITKNEISPSDLFKVASMFFYGKGIKKDNDMAIRYMVTALNKIDRDDVYTKCYYNRFLTKIYIEELDKQRVESTLKNNIELGDDISALMLGEIYTKNAFMKNKSKGYKYISLAANMGNKEAIAILRQNGFKNIKIHTSHGNPNSLALNKAKGMIMARCKAIEDEIDRFLKGSSSIGGENEIY